MARLYRPKEVYDCFLLRFCDGDTVRLLVKLNLEVWREISCRLPGVESWEPHGPDRARAIAAICRAEQHFSNCFGTVEILRSSLDRHGRILGEARFHNHNLSEWVVANNIAWRVERSHTHARPKPITKEKPCNASNVFLDSASC
jgi:hypothetical protein